MGFKQRHKAEADHYKDDTEEGALLHMLALLDRYQTARERLVATSPQFQTSIVGTPLQTRYSTNHAFSIWISPIHVIFFWYFL